MLEPSSSEDEGDDAISRTSSHQVGKTRRRPSREDEVVSTVSGYSSVREAPSSSSSVYPPSSSSYHPHHHYASPGVSAPRATSPGSSSGNLPDSSVPYSSSSQSGSTDRLQTTSTSGRGSSCATARPSSPSPSQISDSRDSSKLDESDRAEREESERKIRLQLYVFVARCISYPFNAKQPTDVTRRNQKLQKGQLEQIQSRLHSFLKEGVKPSDEHFFSTVQSYVDVFLSSDRLQVLVKGGACSLHDLKEVFRQEVKKKVKRLPDQEGSSKESLINSWMGRFECLIRGDKDDDSKSKSTPRFQLILTPETILTKDQLYDLFQGVLSIKKFEHQLLFK